MNFIDRDTMTADEARTSKTLKGKSRMQIDEITAEIKETEKKHNAKN